MNVAFKDISIRSAILVNLRKNKDNLFYRYVIQGQPTGAIS